MFVVTFSLIVSLVFLLIVAGAAMSRGSYAAAGGISALALLFGFLCLSPAVFLQALLTCLVALICGLGGLSAKAFVRGAVGAMVVSYAIVFATKIPQFRELHALRVRFPVESMNERLAYERPWHAAEQTDGSAAHDTFATQPQALAVEVESRLKNSEQQTNYATRRYALEGLHSTYREDFILAQGFGPVRMAYFGPRAIELPELPPVPQPASDYSPDAPPLGPLAARPIVDAIAPARSSLVEMHFDGHADFLNGDRMGYAESRQHVVGFEPHAFSKLPALKDQRWQVARVELVSLLRHEKPCAYVSQNLPRMDELREAPTRPLEAFELTAIDKLRRDEDLVVDETPGRIRMVGSLRAGQTCCTCHDAARGALLGALSYDLVPAGAARPRVVEEPPAKPQAIQEHRGTFLLVELPR